MNTKELLVDVLVGLVQSVTEEPKRVLFRGVADLYEPFLERAQADNLEWVVLKTAPGVDVVGARNNRGIQVLVVFYREEVGERESLNAFRVFNEADVASALVARAADGGLGVTFSPGARDRVQSILRLVYPSAEDLANFLLRGESQMGDALPFVGLFRDPDLPVTLALPRWQARVQENYEAAVLRWREFLEKGVRSQASQRLLGNRVALLRQAAEEPSARAPVLTQVSLAEALRVLNPPNRVVGRLLELPEWTHDRAEAFYADVRAGRVDPYEPPAGTPPLPRDVVDLLDRIRPKTDDDENTVESGEAAAPRLRFCLQALLTLAAQDDSLPQRLRLTRPESEDQEFADLVRDPDTGRWSVAFSDEGARRLSTLASGASELAFALYRRGRVRGLFCASRSTTWPDASPLTRSAGRTRKPGTGQRESIPRTPRRGEPYARRRPGYRRSSTPSGARRKMSASRTTPSTRSSTSSTWPTGTHSRSSSKHGSPWHVFRGGTCGRTTGWHGGTPSRRSFSALDWRR